MYNYAIVCLLFEKGVYAPENMHMFYVVLNSAFFFLSFFFLYIFWVFWSYFKTLAVTFVSVFL